MGVKGLRNAAIVAFILSMAALLLGGYFAMDKVPPIPEKVVSGETVLTDHDTIMQGQDVYQRYGLMDHGSVWGHGTLRDGFFGRYPAQDRAAHARFYGRRQSAVVPGLMTNCPPSVAGKSTPM